MSRGEIAIEARDISHRYSAGEPALRGVDWVAEQGQITALIGANGSGKSTLLRILAGSLVPATGTVLRFGLEDLTPSDRRHRIALVSQEPALDPEMTGEEILNLVAALYGLDRTERRRRISRVATAFGLTTRLSRRVEIWSGGQRRRLHLAAGMLQDPELLCLDEPTTGLDPNGRAFLWGELRRRSQRGRGTLIVTHDLEAAEQHAGAVAILDRGILVVSGTPDSLVAEHPPSLAEVYRYHTGREPETPAKPGSRAGSGRRRGGRR